MPTDSTDRVSERRQATVLFADISGFTSMSERMDPEDVTHIMNGCFRLMESVVRTHGGTVDKYIGDCIMALFGVPTAIENAPQQALNSAIEMRHRLEEFNREHELAVPLKVHTGVNTGLVLAGHVGGDVKRDFTVMGDAVNLASRLKDAAPNGTIYVGPDTYRLTRNVFEFRTLKPLTLKGKEQPVQTYELTSAAEHVYRARPVRTERMIYADLIGREQELRRLEQAVADVSQGQGAILTLVGEAGLGKSRLMAELGTLEITTHVRLLEGRSLSIGDSLSFHPFIDLLRHWAGIKQDESDHDALAKLRRAVGELRPDDTDDVLPFVATVMGVRLEGESAARVEGIEGEALEKLIQKTMRELFASLAAQKPLVLIFEDLHWADLSSVGLLENLLRLAAEHAILFLLAFRPDYADTSERVVALAREAHGDRLIQIDLEPLSEHQCDLLVGSLLQIDDLPHSTRALIASKADGNPFYIEEVVRSLIDTGIVESKDGRMRVTERIENVVIPETIQGVIMARVDRLAEPARQVLQVASIVGRSFYHRVIAEVLKTDRNLETELTYLEERQLILRRQTHRTGDERRKIFKAEIEYTFKHALVQETIYESILQRTRKELHLRVAESIETTFADRLVDFYGMLAYHFSRAERLEKAEEYLFKAGDEAERASASSEALQFFREASRLYLVIHGDGGDPAKKALLEKKIGLALLARGKLGESVEHFDHALEYLGERIPRGTRAVRIRFALDLASVLARLYLRPDSIARAGHSKPSDREILEVRYNRARAQTTSDPQRMFFDTIGTIRRMNQTDPSAIEEACGMYAGAALLFSYSGVSFGVSRRILAIAERLVRTDSFKDLFVYRTMRFMHAYLEGDWGDEYVIDDALVDQNLRHGQMWDVNTYLGAYCERTIHQGRFATTAALRERLTDLGDVYGLDFAHANHNYTTVLLLMQQRRFREALRAAETYFVARREDLVKILALGLKAKNQALLGDRAAALATLALVEERSRRAIAIPPYYRSVSLLARFQVDVDAYEGCLGSGDRTALRAAGRTLRRSQKAALGIVEKAAWERTEALRLAGRAAWLLGAHDKAMQWLTRSVEAGTRLRAHPELARTHMEIAQRIVEGGTSVEVAGRDATGHLEAARALLIEMNLERDLQQLAEIERRAA